MGLFSAKQEKCPFCKSKFSPGLGAIQCDCWKGHRDSVVRALALVYVEDHQNPRPPDVVLNVCHFIAAEGIMMPNGAGGFGVVKWPKVAPARVADDRDDVPKMLVEAVGEDAPTLVAEFEPAPQFRGTIWATMPDEDGMNALVEMFRRNTGSPRT